ncbi:uncharacterized protein KNAG_0C01110 [Huiozyma naganishii CBS 8797]|uniref:Cell wall mannoprotein PIR1-like C-terminal domain-containing protein n=1 Tax=Huiozyma naganishii (strain ATCC MYA-139 / BCRC 22969 / CBS 8797 / KCTC 17520 / NBRC 10181 / NCYC 3082 / Yp74L-3) TaxID=1071383 RepID=J7S4C4_HUIN7|nr:hypothetical protein KNAG_0C01110 [Kazachstania naganishii CBS 8797]CCK69224.1 hypothetical protein KNAG_0C01110 [Kazachstania naganishii CBS 8797]
MQSKIIAAATLAAVATSVAADGYTPGNPWTTLTASGSYNCGLPKFTSSFGIAVQPITTNAKRGVVSQINDGQIQATASVGDGTTTITKAVTKTLKPTKASSVVSSASSNTTISSSTTASSCAATATVNPSANSCKNSGTLQLTLNDGVLTDGKGRIGSIVSNRQFQFDGPTPQAGALLAKGWSITPAGNLALGEQDVFYQCLSGNFYNLYDQHIAEQCSPIHLEVVGLIDC